MSKRQAAEVTPPSRPKRLRRPVKRFVNEFKPEKCSDDFSPQDYENAVLEMIAEEAGAGLPTLSPTVDSDGDAYDDGYSEEEHSDDESFDPKNPKGKKKTVIVVKNGTILTDDESDSESEESESESEVEEESDYEEEELETDVIEILEKTPKLKALIMKYMKQLRQLQSGTTEEESEGVDETPEDTQLDEECNDDDSTDDE